jgi:hypothetical protein
MNNDRPWANRLQTDADRARRMPTGRRLILAIMWMPFAALVAFVVGVALWFTWNM